MEHILELKEEINKLSDDLLIKKFENKPVAEGEFNYYPVFAKRMKNFKVFIFKELISERNTKINLKTFKPSWYIAISVLDYCEDEKIITEMLNHIRNNWSKDDFESFVDYANKETKFQRYFQKI